MSIVGSALESCISTEVSPQQTLAQCHLESEEREGERQCVCVCVRERGIYYRLRLTSYIHSS